MPPLPAVLLALLAPVAGCSSSGATGSPDASSTEGDALGDATSLDGSTPGDGGHDAPADAPAEGTTPATTTLAALLANNTSASSAFVDSYTPAARFNGSTTPVSNYDAPANPTSTTDLTTGRVSKVPVKSLLYPGATTAVYVETQSWFCTSGKTPIPTVQPADQCGSHIDVGYSTNYTAHVALQIADMTSRGVDGAIIDWEGQSAGTGATDTPSTSSTAIDTGSMFLFQKAAEASSGAFHFAVIEDEGIKACAAQSGCDVTTQLLSDISFLSTNFFGSPAYLKSGGRPVLFFFSVDAWVSPYGKTIDWATVRSGAAGDPLFVFENAGGFTHASSDGAYSWVSPTAIGSYPGSDPFGTSGFLPYYYGQAASHAALLGWGSAYKGFDDLVVNGWGGGERYAGQQCGKTWLDTFAVANGKYSTTSQLAGLQLVTWDDYEEGTELETGIDDHLTVAASLQGGGGTLAWTVAFDANAPAECTQAASAGFDPGTLVDHYAVYASPASDGKNVFLVDGAVAATARSFDLAGKLAAGSYQLFVYAVAKPFLFDQLSGAVAYTAP
jgi:hypothetical protein